MASTPTYRSALYRAMQAAADKAGAVVRSTFSRQVGALHASTSLASLQRGISGGVHGVVREVDWAGFEKNLREEYQRRLTAAMKKGAAQFQDTFKYKFDPDATDVKRLVNRRARELAHQLTMESKRGFRQATRGLFKEGAGKKRTAEMLKDTLGLTRRQAQTVVNVRKKLLGDGVNINSVDKRASTLVKKYRNQRARRIARTAGIDVAEAGQNAILTQAIKEGDIDASDVERVWITSFDACPICAPMSGQIRAPGKTFTTGEGGEVNGPTVHVNCRCSITIRLKEGR